MACDRHDSLIFPMTWSYSTTAAPRLAASLAHAAADSAIGATPAPVDSSRASRSVGLACQITPVKPMTGGSIMVSRFRVQPAAAPSASALPASMPTMSADWERKVAASFRISSTPLAAASR